MSQEVVSYYEDLSEIEKKAWELIKNANTDTKLTVINPSGVIGPSLTSEISSTQLIIAGLMNGRIPVNLPIHIGYVDVRDVALAHIKALENPNSDGERIILSNTELWHKDVSKILKDGGYKAPWLTVSVPVAKFLANVVPALKGAKRFLGKDMVKNTTKAEDILGISYIDIKKSILDDAKSLTEFNKV